MSFRAYADSRTPEKENTHSGRLTYLRNAHELNRYGIILDVLVQEEVNRGRDFKSAARMESSEALVRLVFSLGLKDNDFHGEGFVAAEAIMGRFSTNVQPLGQATLAHLSTICNNVAKGSQAHQAGLKDGRWAVSSPPNGGGMGEGGFSGSRPSAGNAPPVAACSGSFKVRGCFVPEYYGTEGASR